jgi:hypothetical protein
MHCKVRKNFACDDNKQSRENVEPEDITVFDDFANRKVERVLFDKLPEDLCDSVCISFI